MHFAGYLDRDTALLDCYAAANVFVFASRTETQGLVLLEAMAQGTPVVSTAELGTRSILAAGCGALVVRGGAGAVRRGGGARAAGCELRSELGERGRAYARTWSSAAMAQRLADLYCDAASRTGAPGLSGDAPRDRPRAASSPQRQR